MWIIHSLIILFSTKIWNSDKYLLQASIYHVPIEMIQQDVHGILKERLKLSFEIPKPKWVFFSSHSFCVIKFLKAVFNQIKLNDPCLKNSVADPHWLYADPDPQNLVSADPDPVPDPWQ